MIYFRRRRRADSAGARPGCLSLPVKSLPAQRIVSMPTHCLAFRRA